MTTSSPSTMINTEWSQYWNRSSEDYCKSIDAKYHNDRMTVADALLADIDLVDSDIVDFGCGDGVTLQRLSQAGAHTIGIDTSDVMIDSSRTRLKTAALSAKLIHGGVEQLESCTNASIDGVISLNVLAYLTQEEESTFYQHISRILRPGGWFIAMHSNELFDLYTLNSYTASFITKHFTSPGHDDKINSLLTHPNVPNRLSYNIRENPLTYRFKLAEFGLKEVQQEFANYHRLPPILMDDSGDDSLSGDRDYPNTLNWSPGEQWKLMFMCSIYASRSVKLRS